MPQKPTDKIIAVAVTVAVHIAVLILLMTGYMKYVDDSATRRWPPVDKSELLVVEDEASYVKMGNIAESTSASEELSEESDATPQEASPALDLKTQGEKATPPEPITTKRESPMKVEKKEQSEKPEKTGPTKEELAEQQRIKEEKEIRERVASRTKFNSTGNGGKGAGSAGSPNGNSNIGATSGTPGHSLTGRSFVSAGKPSSTKSGEIVIKIKVDASGRVTEATYLRGSGPANGDASVRESCRKAALQSKFTSGDADQTGTITWKFV